MKIRVPSTSDETMNT